MRSWVTSSVVFPQPLQAINLTRAIVLSQEAMYCVNSTIEIAQLSPKSPVVTLFTAKFNIQRILPSAHTVYQCVLYGSQKKQQLFPYAALTD